MDASDQSNVVFAINHLPAVPDAPVAGIRVNRVCFKIPTAQRSSVSSIPQVGYDLVSFWFL